MSRFGKSDSVNTENAENTVELAEEYSKRADVHQEAVKDMRKTFLKTSIFTVAVVVAITVFSVAWFLNNSRVGMNEINIAADTAEKYVLASSGVRLTSELEKYKANGENILIDTAGEEYDSYYDIHTGKTVTLQDGEKLMLYKGTAWHLQDNGTMQPGSRGVLEFFVIPQVDGINKLQFVLNAVGYKNNSDVKNPVLQVTDPVLNELLVGHILFFTDFDDVKGYNGWLGAGEKEIEVKAKQGNLQKNIPYKVSIYWIWPGRYRNFIYHQNATHGDLFASESKDYNDLLDFVNGDGNRAKFLYNYGEGTGNFETKIDMDDSDYALGTSYYNRADEYIGNNVNYIYLEIKPK